MENKIQIFDNAEFGQVRVLGTPEEPLFVATDIATALGYKNTRDAIAKHVNDEDKNTVAIHDGIGNPNKVVINESGVYALIFGSKLEQAKKFKHWVTSEVLPTIRRQGGYGELSKVADSLSKTMSEMNKMVKIITDSTNQMTSAMTQIVHVVSDMQKQTFNQLNQNQNQTEKRPSTKPNKDEITVTELCHELGYNNARDLNNKLSQLGVIIRNGADITLAPRYKHIGRIKQWHTGDGGYTSYIVYTQNGINELKTIIN